MLSRDLMNRLAEGWDKRSRVRANTDTSLFFDPNKDDFLEHLLPFAQHPLYKSAPFETRKQILSCGWIIYNAKTICIETDIVNPVCVSLLNERFAGTEDFIIKQLITETMVDEAYHIHLCSHANEITKKYRNLKLYLPRFAFINQMQQLKEFYSENWQRDLIQLATSITSEIYITDYLELIHHENKNIQPLNSTIVKTHRSDELAHGKIFNYIAQLIFNNLGKKQQAFFCKIMLKPLSWLTNPELDVWLSVLQQLNFKHAATMLRECKFETLHSVDANVENFQSITELTNLLLSLGFDKNDLNFEEIYR